MVNHISQQVHLLFQLFWFFDKQWRGQRTRAVWNEVDKDGMGEVFEQTVPSNWIINKILHWPNHLNAKRSFKNQEDPTSEWHQFKLIKVKVTGQLIGWLDIFKALFCIYKMVVLCPQGLVPTMNKMRPVRLILMGSFFEHFLFSFY